MRLICPNCDAQYEVPETVIPETGRDVQCSNCGSTWFQHHPSNDPELLENADPAETPEWSNPEPDHQDPEPEQFAEPDQTPEDQPQQPLAEHGFDQDDDTYDEDDFEDDDAPMSPPPSALRRQLDPSVADLLREEAEREAKARERDSQRTNILETQPDLGLQDPEDDAEKRARETRDRMARLRGEDPAVAASAPKINAAASRRELLPDIEEINSTLRATSDRRPATADDHDTPSQARPNTRDTIRPSGFRRGFLLMVLLAVIATLIYLYAPQIGEKIPAVSPYLDGYSAWINDQRIALDGQMQHLVQWLDGMASTNETSGQ